MRVISAMTGNPSLDNVVGSKELLLFVTTRPLNPGGENFLMSGIRVCATDQGRFFTSKNPE